MILFNHLHVKGPRPGLAAKWYVRWLGAKVISNDHRMADGSRAFILDLGGIRLFVSGRPPKAALREGDAGLHAGLEHFAVTIAEDPESFVHRLASARVPVLVPPFTNRYGARIAFIQGPDNVRIELVHYPHSRPTGA